MVFITTDASGNIIRVNKTSERAFSHYPYSAYETLLLSNGCWEICKIGIPDLVVIIQQYEVEQ